MFSRSFEIRSFKKRLNEAGHTRKAKNVSNKSNSLIDFYELWDQQLPGDSDRELLLQGIKKCFRITDPNSQFTSVKVGNYKSATSPENVSKVEKQIISEIEEGHYVFLQN